MGIEIEKKFLVDGGNWRVDAESASIRQGYLVFGPPVAIRVRIEDSKAHINIKQATTAIRRAEFEYPIPVRDAEELLREFCLGHPIVKTRHRITHAGHRWEIDEFHDANAGLVVAEVELESEDDVIALPAWAGAEVSGDARYLNSSLAQHPYREWK